jgi:hypothetical protein
MWGDRTDTLASLRQLLSAPPHQRRGVVLPVKVPAVTAGQSYTRTIDGGYWERLIGLTFTFTASATVANRGLQWNLLDGDGALFDLVQIIPVVSASQVVQGTADFTLPVSAQSQNSSSTYGSAAAPSAGTTLLTTLVLQPGTYQIAWTAEVGGTLAAGTDNDNFGVYSGATLLERSVNPAVAGAYPQQVFDQLLTAVGSLTVKNIGAGTAASTYAAELVATPIDQIFGEGQLPDMVIPAGWQWQLQVINAQAADQITNLNYIVERYASNYANGGMADEERHAIDVWIRDLAQSGQ